MSGYFEPNTSYDESMLPEGGLELYDEEGESEISEDEIEGLRKDQEQGPGTSNQTAQPKFRADLEKSLKIANKNTAKNSMNLESSDEDDSDEEEPSPELDDESSLEQINEGSSDSDDEVVTKIPPPKHAKHSKLEESSSDSEDSDSPAYHKKPLKNGKGDKVTPRVEPEKAHSH